MGQAVPFSAAAVIVDVAAAAVAALDRLADERGLSADELAQLAAFGHLEAAARQSEPGSRGMYRIGEAGGAEPLRWAINRCGEAVSRLLPLVELLDMRAAVPRDWLGLAVSLDTLLWLGVTRFADDLSFTTSSARRQEQSEALRRLQGAIGKVIQLSLSPPLPEPKRRQAIERLADDQFTRTTNAIGDDLAAICREIAARRKRR